MYNNLNFINGCMIGIYTSNEIDNFIQKWHNSNSDKSLPEFLGMNEETYKLWVENPEFLDFMVNTLKDIYQSF